MNPKALSSETLIAMIEMLKKAWKATLGPQAQAVQRKGALDAELDDEIPFR